MPIGHGSPPWTCVYRKCHNIWHMDFMCEAQRASRPHEKISDEGETCIGCHRGIAHTRPKIETDTIGRPETTSRAD